MVLPAAFFRATPAIVISAVFAFAARSEPVAGAARNPAPASELAGRAGAALRQILAGQESWEQMHAAEALIACGKGESVWKRFEAESEEGTPPYRTSVWRMLALTAPNAAVRGKLILKIEQVLLDPAASDRFTAAEILCKLNQRLRGSALAAVQAMAVDPVRLNSIFGLWALAVAGQPGAVGRIALLLSSSDPDIRSRSASALRWLRPSDPAMFGALARAADAEPAVSPAYPSVLSSALVLNADPKHAAQWRAKLEEVVKAGPGRRRWEALQSLVLTYTEADLPRVASFLDDRQADSRTGAAWSILHVLGHAPPRGTENQPRW